MKGHLSLLSILLASLFLVTTQIPSTQALVLAGTHRPPAVPEGYVATPSGYFHPSCVRGLSKGDILMSDWNAIQHANGLVENIPPCAYPHYTARGDMVIEGKTESAPPEISGWVEYAYTETSTSYGNFTAIWPVPPAPTATDGQVVYFFPGLQPVPGTAKSILQPVLQYGNNNSFGGYYWVIASWNCCITGTTFYSTPITVNVGDTILGSINMTCSAGTESCGTWNVTTEDDTLAKTTILSKTSSYGQTFNWAAIALEAYYIVQCNDYPPGGSLTFSDIGLYNYDLVQITPSWTTVVPPSGATPQCGYGVQTTPTSVTLDFATTSPPLPPLCTATTSCGLQGQYPGQVVAGSVTLQCKEAMILTASATICGNSCVTDSAAPPVAVTGLGAGDATLGSGGSCNLSWSWGGNNYGQTIDVP